MERLSKDWLLERVVISESDCWIWKGAKTSRGYGHVILKGNKNKTTHHLSWELFRGPIPNGKLVLHDCPGKDNPACCNPDHLWIGTQFENMRDMVNKGSHNKAIITLNDAKKIRSLFANGSTIPELANSYNLRRSHIKGIIAGKCWSERDLSTFRNGTRNV